MTRSEIRKLQRLLLPRDYRVLDSVDTYRLLTTRHIQRLHFDVPHSTPVAAARACSRVVARLRELGVLRSLERRIGGVRAGSAGFVWYVGPAGERLLRATAAGGSRGRRNYGEPSRHFVDHTLAVADLAVQTTEITRHGDVELLEIEAEPASWRQALSSHGTVRWLKPDLRLVTATTAYEHHWFVEVDLATEHLPVIRRQCAAYQTYRATGRYQSEHSLFPIVLWVTPDDTRTIAIRRCILRDPALDDALFQVCSRFEYAAHLDVTAHATAPGDDP